MRSGAVRPSDRPRAGRQARSTGATKEPVEDPTPTLAELGIGKKLHARSRAVATVCGVSHPFVESIRREELVTVSSSTRTRTSLDGKERPARRLVDEPQEPGDGEEPMV